MTRPAITSFDSSTTKATDQTRRIQAFSPFTYRPTMMTRKVSPRLNSSIYHNRIYSFHFRLALLYFLSWAPAEWSSGFIGSDERVQQIDHKAHSMIALDRPDVGCNRTIVFCRESRPRASVSNGAFCVGVSRLSSWWAQLGRNWVVNLTARWWNKTFSIPVKQTHKDLKSARPAGPRE